MGCTLDRRLLHLTEREREKESYSAYMLLVRRAFGIDLRTSICSVCRVYLLSWSVRGAWSSWVRPYGKRPIVIRGPTDTSLMVPTVKFVIHRGRWWFSGRRLTIALPASLDDLRI